MGDIVGIRLKKAGRVSYFDPAGFDLEPGEHVIVETERGPEVGYVVVAPRQVVESDVTEPLKPVVRKATPDDLQHVENNKQAAKRAVASAMEAAGRLGLGMKMLAAQYTLDRSRITIYFSAEGRVDFRDLVRELAGVLRTRVELHQVGAREQAKTTGGLGRCGRALCCSSWMMEFPAVSVRMAKEQELPVGQSQLAGMCGRLRCCLRYESEGYADLQQRVPNVGDQVVTPRGVATVLRRSLVKEQLTLRLPDDEIVEMTLAEVRLPVAGGCGGACACATRADAARRR